MIWYYAINRERMGPVDPAQLAQLVQQGTVQHDTLVWRQGMADWKPYGEVAVVEGLPAPGGVPDPDTEVCVISGKRHPRREMINYEGQWVSAEHRDAFFQRLREGVALPAAGVAPGGYGYAGFWLRFVALLIDGLILGAVGLMFGFGMVAIVAAGVTPQDNAGLFILMQVVLQLVSIAIGIAYEIYFIRKFDATPGKMVLGLKLVRADGTKLTVGRIVGRYFGKMVSSFTLMIGYIIAAFDDQKRTLHDRMCDTRVIRIRA
jgi:uncharacterized RDD family membrane protein YckC